MRKPTMILSGPMFELARDEWRESSFKKDGGHYNIFHTHTPQKATELLKLWFPKGEANEFNLVVFSTSGIHGMYTTIEEIEASLKKYPDGPPTDGDDEEWPDDYSNPELTFVVIQARIVSMTYGNAAVTLADIPWLKKLRASSQAVFSEIGVPEKKP